MSRNTNIPLRKTKRFRGAVAASVAAVPLLIASHNGADVECDVRMDGNISNTKDKIETGGADSDTAVLQDSNHQTVDPTSRGTSWDGAPTVYDEENNPGQGDFLRFSAPNAKVCQEIGDIVLKSTNS